jgi:hypothetical protein
MLASHRYKFIYIKTLKTAGTSTEAFFQRYCLSPEEELSYKPEHSANESVTKYGIIGSRWRGRQSIGRWRNHKTSKDIKNSIGDSIFNEYTKICNIRNPYDIAVSLYHWNGGRGEQVPADIKLFTKWLNNPNKISTLKQNKVLWAIDNKYNFDYIRYENLEEDILKVCKKLGINVDQVVLPEYKISEGRKHYTEYYTEDTKKIIEKIYAKELEVFGYTF